MSAGEQAQLAAISAHEPRIFPGVVHERARRNSLRISTSGSDMRASTLTPALAKWAEKERAEASQTTDSD